MYFGRPQHLSIPRGAKRLRLLALLRR